MQQNQENFYHTLTTLGNLPAPGVNEFSNEAAMYADYNNATLNMRAQLLLKQQQQQQQQHIQLMNTLLKQQQHFNHMNTLEKSNKSGKSPSTSSMRRANLLNSSKKSKKSLKKHNSNVSNGTTNSNIEEQQNQQQQQQQQPKNYYLLPNVAQQQPNIYNDVNLLTLEAAFNQNNMSLFNHNNNLSNLNGLGNFYLLNNLNQASHLMHPVYNSAISTFSPAHHTLMSPSKNQQTIHNPTSENSNSNANSDLFENKNSTSENPTSGNSAGNKESSIYESSDMDSNLNEQEPMLANTQNHYASSGLLTRTTNAKKQQYTEQSSHLEEQRQLL